MYATGLFPNWNYIYIVCIISMDSMCGETMKKTRILMMVLLFFSVAATSVSASFDGYYAVRFYGSAKGCCLVFADGLPEPVGFGRGKFCINGSAVAQELGPGFYWVAPIANPNTRIWLRSSMKVSWDNEKIIVDIWAPDTTSSTFNTTADAYGLILEFSGYCKGEAGRDYINGTAHLSIGSTTPSGEEVLSAAVMLVTETGHFRSFIWIGEDVEGLPPEYVARKFIHRMTAWPIS